MHELSQSSIASSNSRITYIHTFMYAVPFLITCTRMASSATEKSVFDAGPVNAVLVPSSAAVTQWSA